MSFQAHSSFDRPARASDSAHVDILTPASWEVAGMAGLVLFYLIFQLLFDGDGIDFANIAGPIWFTLVLILGAVRMVANDAVALWIGSFWFRFTGAVYFGIGSVVQLTFNEFTQESAKSFFWVFPDVMLKVNLISAIGAFLFLTTLYLIGLLLRRDEIDERIAESDQFLWAAAVVFCLIGYSVKFLVILPMIVGLISVGSNSGAIASLSLLTFAGLFMLTLWCSLYAPRYLFVPTILLAADMLFGMVSFSKTQVLMPLIVYSLAMLRYQANFRRLAIAAGGVIFVFFVIVPAVQYGRAELQQRYGNINEGSLSDRLEIIAEYFIGNPRPNTSVDEQNTLARIHYAPTAAASVVMFDSGQPGNSLQDIFTVFIPRALWKDKPIYDVGARFNMAINGSADSSSWMGVFTEPYYNYGWWGLPLVFIPLAIGYAILARMAVLILKRAKWLHFPVAFLGVFTAMRMDGDIVTGQVVSFVLCVLLYICANIADGPVRSFFGDSSHRAVHPGE